SFRAIHNRGMTRRRERRMSDSRRDSASRYFEKRTWLLPGPLFDIERSIIEV
ncbi:MAG: hypothetical protein ACI9M3_000328, partial [Bacteroidia bacterium]